VILPQSSVSSRNDDGTTLSLVRTEDTNQACSRLALRFVTTSSTTCRVLDAAKLTLGRAEDAELRVESTGVSRQHAELVRQGPVFAVRDLSSRNGTFLNGKRIQHGALSEGDVLRLGDAIGVVTRVDPAFAQEPPTELGGALFGPDVREQLEQLRRVGPSNLPVVLVGETGVGKESAARAVHLLSGRSGPFHAVNCAALPTALAEAELFGYKRGAFSGSEHASLGHLRAAEGGTLLLDELADLSHSTQAKLLRALQEKRVAPLGESREIAVDVRIVAACQEPLAALVQSRRLRQDLAARLAGATLELPPLRSRRSDTAFLFGYFLRNFSGGRPPRVDPKLLERLLLYGWPDNIRELSLLTQRLLVMHGHKPLLTQSMLPPALGRSEGAEPDAARPLEPAAEDRDEHDLRKIRAALQEHGGNVSRAAIATGISRQRVYRLMSNAARHPVEPAVDDAEGSGGPHV
jgi:transcriptional regulator of acetoin/glycerol metabolism